MKVETLILKNLLLSEEYVRKALPFVKDEYFPDLEERVLFDTINKYFQQYSAVPTKEALLIEIGDNKSLSDEQYKNCLLYTSPSPRDYAASRMPSSA